MNIVSAKMPRSQTAISPATMLTKETKQGKVSALGKVASYVPDLIVYSDLSQEVPFIENFDGVLLFIDISGFTALTEKFSMNAKLDSGIEELAQTLNHFVEDIVEEVLVFGGDVLKFAGDALLALWRVERCYIGDIITLAIKCSLRIQEEYGICDTDVGVELRLKIGLSAGHISKIVVGDHREQYFLVIGRPVDEVRLAQNLANASDIILSPNCWELCDRNLTEVERIPGERSVKVRYVKILPGLPTSEFFTKCQKYLSHHINDTFENLRYAAVLEPDEELENHLRRYVMRNVLKKIDDNQPLEYLSELRSVTIIFVNLHFEAKANTDHLCKSINDAILKIKKIIQPLSGKMNKVFMFDKGCTFLCLFGLPGDKHVDESANALNCAHDIHAFCSTALMKVKVVSIGVTTGPVFCGVVGHRVRHEYTVIGQKVNLAARMMMCYPGLVTCDAVTYEKSKLPQDFFEELPFVEMKGIQDPGIVYQFCGIAVRKRIYKASLTRERTEHYPLLGRKKETDVFEKLLQDFKRSKKSHVIIYKGLMGYGKSQLMAEIAYLGQAAGQRVVAMELTKINMCQKFFAIQTLMAMFLGIHTCKTYDERQDILISKLFEVVMEEYLCLLNNLFYVKFPLSEEVSKMDKNAKNEKIEHILVNILANVAEKKIIIFVIDEAQFIDSVSWDFLDRLLKKVAIFVVMSWSPVAPVHQEGRLPCDSAARIINSPATTLIQLSILAPSVIIQKACQYLDVVSIARELETFLIQRSHGNPFYCEELLQNLDENDMLQFPLLKEDEDREDEWDSLFAFSILKRQDSDSLSNGNELCTCTISQNVNLCNMMLPPTLKGIALAELDNMNPSEQMVIKCAAIIGETFTTELLFHILPEWTKMKMYQTLATLVGSHIFQCFSSFCERKEQMSTERQDAFSNKFYKCRIPKEVAGEVSDIALIVFKRLRQEKKVMQNDVMGFSRPLLQEAAYELWLKSQKRALHLKCVDYLERRAHRCKCCGRGDFIFFHRYAVDGMVESTVLQESTFQKILGRRLEKAAVVLVSETLKKVAATPFEDTDLEESIDLLSDAADLQKPSTSKENTGERQFTSQGSLRAELPEWNFLRRMDEICHVGNDQTSVKSTTQSSECQCEEIIESVIVPLSQHCLALGNYPRAFYYLLECASGYVQLSNNYMAFTYLNTAENLLKSLGYKLKIINHFEQAVFYSLKGEVSYNMGQMTAAKKLIKKALTLLKRSFPTTILGVFFKRIVENLKHLSYQKKKKKKKKNLWQMTRREKRRAVLCQQGHCLSLLWQLFSLDLARSSSKFSHLAALMKVNCAEESQDKSQIISSYMELSLCCQLMGYQDESLKYELMAIKCSSHLQVSGEGLIIMTKLARSLAYMKLCSGNFPLAIELGFRAHELCQQHLNKPKLESIILFDLFTSLFLSARYQDSVKVLSWLDQLSIQDGNVIGQACFITGCLNIMLYAGFSFKPFQHCLDFVLSNETNCILMSQNNIMFDLYTSLSVWYARLEVWDKFVPTFEKGRRLLKRITASLHAQHTICKLIECEALWLRKCLSEEHEKADEIYNRISKNLEQIITQCSTSPVFYPRLYHLKAYLELLMKNDVHSCYFIDKAIQNSELLYEKHLEQSWLEISKEWWFTGTCPMEDWWLKTAPDFPVWKVGMTSEEMGTFYENKYLLPLPNILHTIPSFPETLADH